MFTEIQVAHNTLFINKSHIQDDGGVRKEIAQNTGNNCPNYLFEIRNHKLRFWGYKHNPESQTSILGIQAQSGITNFDSGDTSTNDDSANYEVGTKGNPANYEVSSVNYETFQHKIEDFKTNETAKTVLFYVRNGNIHTHIRLLCETLTKHIDNVCIIGHDLWNITVNQVHYLNVNSIDNLQLISQLKVTSVYIEDFTFFLLLHDTLFRDATITFIYNYRDPADRYNEILHNEEHERNLTRNLLHCVHKYVFFNNTDLTHYQTQ